MDHVFTIAEERLNLFARMANSACGLSLWCFGMKKQLYTCTCPAEKEFRLFLDLGQCLDYCSWSRKPCAHFDERPYRYALGR